MINSKLQTLIKESLQNFELAESYGHRSVGDKIEADCSSIVKSNFSDNFVKPKSKRSIDDFTLMFNDKSDMFDVKTHFIQSEKGFSMPNLISVKRLKKVLENGNQSVSYIFVDYIRENGIVKIQNVHVKYIWELDWSILSIGALGKGQLQIKDANKQLIFTDMGKDKWFSILKDKVLAFYKKEIKKIEKEILNWN
jgi:hypothetical protein